MESEDMTNLTCFKGYDVRGQLGVNLDEAITRRIGQRASAFSGRAVARPAMRAR